MTNGQFARSLFLRRRASGVRRCDRPFLDQIASLGDLAERPQQACLAVASPVDEADEMQAMQLTNSAWRIDHELSQRLGNIPFRH